jgi:hypothetical protein
MQEIYKLPANDTPLVHFELNGNLLLKGRSLVSDINQFYEPLIEWVKQLNTIRVRFCIELDYYNTSSAKKLMELLKEVENNPQVKEFEVIWQYEEDDEDTLEKGIIFSEKLKKAKFTFSELIEV